MTNLTLKHGSKVKSNSTPGKYYQVSTSYKLCSHPKPLGKMVREIEGLLIG